MVGVEDALEQPPPVGDFPQTVPDGVLEEADDMPRMLKLVDIGPYLSLPRHVMSG